jgi:hypothetical protein
MLHSTVNPQGLGPAFIHSSNIKTMEQIRIIHFSNESGSKEAVYFTDDFVTPATEFVRPGYTLDKDVTIEASNWPSTFPMNYCLLRD